MAITTLTNAKDLLNITNNDKDLWIAALIPKVEADYQQIRNKPFDTGNTLTVTSAATSAGDVTVIVDGVDYGIEVKSGDSTMLVAQRIYDYFTHNVRISGSAVTFTGKAFTLAFDGGTTGVTATLSGMATIYPDDAEFTAIKMINYHLKTSDAMGKVSESLGDYSVSYDRGESSADYPKDIVGGIKRYVNTV